MHETSRQIHQFIGILFLSSSSSFSYYYSYYHSWGLPYFPPSHPIHPYSNLLHEQLHSAHTHTHTHGHHIYWQAQNHRQLIMWKMYEKKMEKLALAQAYQPRARTHAEINVYLADRHEWQWDDDWRYTWLVLIIPFTLTNQTHTYYYYISNASHQSMPVLTLFRLFSPVIWVKNIIAPQFSINTVACVFVDTLDEIQFRRKDTKIGKTKCFLSFVHFMHWAVLNG